MITCRFFHRYYSTFKQPFSGFYRIKLGNSNKLPQMNFSTGPKNIFQGKEDRFKGVIVDLCKETCKPADFSKKLSDSLEEWTTEGKRCIWFKVDIKNAAQVPILAQKGFTFHHAQDDIVMMYKWLPKDSLPNLPPPSHTNLGVGAMVFNKDNKLLAVSERSLHYPHWKLPGGYVNKGEDIKDAAIREVEEETGIKCRFESLITFRHTHNMNYGNSDIYVLMRMSALTEEIKMSSHEISDCRWMDVEEYVNNPKVHEFNKLIVKKALEYKDKKLKLDLQKRQVSWWKYTREMHFLTIEELK